ncbi:ATP-binding cassette domain-containing protein (plasmid) [Bacillus mycoides]|uniref:ATP-binding cassette domain-containing protein n=1 Tax=Bacillus mycoides TaxID=1405 RepID=UPI003F74C768
MTKIDIKKITKLYGRKKALDELTLQFENGKIYGFLGSNGAGKTTLINIITNRAFATSGEVFIDGLPVQENEFAQGKIFCITEKGNYPSDLKVKELFVWEKRFHPKFDIDYANKIAKKFDLDVNSRLKSLSTGYATIVKVVLTIASNAEIMILDEPVLGIDALYREIFYDVLLEHHKEKKNLVIIATHLISEVERVLEKVVIISNGKVLEDRDIKDLTLEGEGLNEVYVRLLRESKNG